MPASSDKSADALAEFSAEILLSLESMRSSWEEGSWLQRLGSGVCVSKHYRE